MTPQEIFNAAYIGVVKQGEPSVNEFGNCAYRGEGGMKCAVGHMIDDETAKEWDGLGGVNDFDLEFGRFPNWVSENIALLEEIQTAHDWSSSDRYIPNFLYRYKSEMEKIATKYNLTIPEVTQ